jgi:hypothetical protein
MQEPVRPGAVAPDRALCLPTFSYFLIVNKTSLSSSLSSLDGSEAPPPLSLIIRRRKAAGVVELEVEFLERERT